MNYLSFDGLDNLYDETRCFDKNCFSGVLDFLIERFPPNKYHKVFEPGIGTGRIALPLTERGYQIVGVDISEKMLTVLKKQIAYSSRLSQIQILKADATKIPFPDMTFHMTVIVHLFYFIREWKKAVDEILRVVKVEAPIILMHTGTGMEIPFLNDRYKALCAQQDCFIKEIGVKSTKEVIDYFSQLGCRVEWIRDRWKWISSIQLDKALGYLKSRAYSFTSITPNNIHSMVIKNLESELQAQFGSLTKKVEIPNQIYLVVIFKK
jgi:ubiquinone/menaquinone biosynthesis C-methylase UbiE